MNPPKCAAPSVLSSEIDIMKFIPKIKANYAATLLKLFPKASFLSIKYIHYKAKTPKTLVLAPNAKVS